MRVAPISIGAAIMPSFLEPRRLRNVIIYYTYPRTPPTRAGSLARPNARANSTFRARKRRSRAQAVSSYEFPTLALAQASPDCTRAKTNLTGDVVNQIRVHMQALQGRANPPKAAAPQEQGSAANPPKSLRRPR